MRRLTFLCSFLFAIVPLLLFAQEITVNNRVLAVVNGKAISVMDVMKKMDMVLYQNYPQYKDIAEARYQFYNSQWKTSLLDMIDRELVLLDAEEKKFEVSAGDVREELEEIFGPNMMLNLDSAGLSLDEAWRMLKAEITIRRMLFMQVRNRVMTQITPGDVKKAYEAHVENLSDQKECTWSCLTVKAEDTRKATEVAETLYTLLEKGQISKEELQKEFGEKNFEMEGVSIAYSPEFRQKSSELAPNLQELFFSLQEGAPSKPQLYTSRQSNTPSVRIYFLHAISSSDVPSMQALQDELKEQIVQERLEQKTEEYFQSLRRRYQVAKEQIEKELPQDFQPFILR